LSLDIKDRKNLLAVNLSLATNLLLAVGRTVVGITGHSPALLADGINSTSDVAYLIVVRIFMTLARKPPDREHPFGHRQLESIAALVTGSFVMATAIAIFWNAINQVYQLLSGSSEFPGAEAIALWVAAFSGLVKIGLYVFTRSISRQTGSLAVLAWPATIATTSFPWARRPWASCWPGPGMSGSTRWPRPWWPW